MQQPYPYPQQPYQQQPYPYQPQQQPQFPIDPNYMQKAPAPNQYNKGGMPYNAAPGIEQASGYPAAVPPELRAQLELDQK